MTHSQELFANFIAHVQGDGCFSRERGAVRYFNQEMDLINDFSNSAEKIFGIKCGKIYSGKTCFHIGFRNKKIANKIKKYYFGSKEWVVPKFVLFGSKKVVAAYLRAFFDDEGSVIFLKRRWGYDRAIQMQSINKKGLKQLQKLLIRFKIDSKLNGPYKEKYFELKIMGRKNLIKFSEKINFVHKGKKNKLKKSIETYKI